MVSIARRIGLHSSIGPALPQLLRGAVQHVACKNSSAGIWGGRLERLQSKRFSGINADIFTMRGIRRAALFACEAAAQYDPQEVVPVPGHEMTVPDRPEDKRDWVTETL